MNTNGADKVPTPEEAKKIFEAAPAQPQVKPAKPRRLLVFSLSWGYKHSAIPYGSKAAEMLAKKTGAFEVVISDDISNFEPGKLKQFDAVFFNNTNNEVFLPENFKDLPPEAQEKARKYDALLKKSFAEYLASGKGLAVLHAGVACFREWPEYGIIVGARFDNHPWVAGTKVTLKVEEPSHPLCRAFKEPFFVVADEIYQLKGNYSREKVRVLVSIDTAKTNMKVGGIHRKDNDFAISYVKPYGRGRVFYCALGHMHELFWNPV